MYVALLLLALPVNSLVPESRLSLLSTGAGDNGGQSSWWARVGDSVFRAPRSGASVNEYYYAYGSHSALPEELKNRRVAGQGRLHVFHLPDGPNATLGVGVAESLPQAGGRRAAISLLMQLKHGMVLNSTFPVFALSPQYTHPLNSMGVGVEQTTSASITPNGVMSFLTQLTSLPNPQVPTRAWSNAQASKAATDFLSNTFSSLGLDTCTQSFAYANTIQKNVIAFIPGTVRDGSSVTIGAHYDSRPYTGAAPGAIDNGSGTAALLAIAAAVKAARIQPLRSIYFVAFAGEEPGLLGSNQFAEALTRGKLPKKCWSGVQTSKHKAIIMDEIAWKSPAFPKRTVNLEAYDWATDVLEHLGQASRSLNGNKITVVHSSNPFGSDHMSFLERRMQAVLTIHGDDEAYPDYHAHTDSIRNADPELLADIAKMNLGGLLRLSGLSGMMA